ncbi:hypothetical protein D3C81_1508400 [compost metagenome]
MQRRPFEKARFIQQQADDDESDEGGGGVPDDGPYRGYVMQRYHAEHQGQQGTECGAPANAEPFGLPDDQDQGEQEDQSGWEHGNAVSSHGEGRSDCTRAGYASEKFRCKHVSFVNKI